MAYNVYICCDKCGTDPFAWTNITVSLSKAEMIAKKNGWKITKEGWYCPECREKYKGVKDYYNEMDSDC